MNMKCKICGHNTELFDKATILGKYEIKYYVCSHCGFVQTEEPYWLNESYSSAIANSDIGLIYRTSILVNKTNLLLKFLGNVQNALDYGGGYGVFVRMMRDHGWNFEWYDENCMNLFAQNHEKSRDHYDVVSSYEVLEHLIDPISTLSEIFRLTDTLLFTTELISDPAPKINDWWYYCTDHGQHISLYSKKSIEVIAQLFNKKHYFINGIHILTSTNIPVNKIKFASDHYWLAKKIFNLKDRPSLLNQDYYEITGKTI